MAENDNTLAGAKLQELLGDPTTGKVPITLSDGITRTLKFGHRAFTVLEEVTKLPYTRATQIVLSATSITALLYAGGYVDALERGEADWSIDKVMNLIDSKDYLTINLRLVAALNYALERMDTSFLGEPPASAVKTKAAKRSHGHGRAQ